MIKSITLEAYNKNMQKIIKAAKDKGPSHTLDAMLNYAASVNIVDSPTVNVRSPFKKKKRKG